MDDRLTRCWGVANSGDAVTKAYNLFYAEYKNFALDRIKSDIIFANHVDNYFELVRQAGIPNDVLCIGDILTRLNAVAV